MLSIVIPVYNEEKNLNGLVIRLEKVLKSRHEIIFINDGSTDNSLKLLLGLQKGNDNIRIISFENNQGQTTALQRGFEEARGDIVVTMDGDLQNFPEDIPKVVQNLKSADVVCGWRKYRKDRFFSKILPSYISNFIIRTFTGLRIRDSGCSLRAYKKNAVKNIQMFGEMHRFIPVILYQKGFKVAEIKVRHAKRVHGKSVYGQRRFLKGLLDLFFVIFLSRYLKRPLHIFGLIGLLTIFMGLLILAADIIFLLFILRMPLIGINIGPLIFISLMLIFFGINFIILGIMSEVVFHTYRYDFKEKIY